MNLVEFEKAVEKELPEQKNLNYFTTVSRLVRLAEEGASAWKTVRNDEDAIKWQELMDRVENAAKSLGHDWEESPRY